MLCWSEANKAAENVFEDVLGRKDRADATRNALSVLNRFKLLFYLPSTIERNIEKVILHFLEYKHKLHDRSFVFVVIFYCWDYLLKF